MINDLVTIRAAVRGELNDVDGQFFSDADIDRWVNQGYLKYVNFLMRTSQGYFEDSVNLNITSGQETVTLPHRFATVNFDKQHIETVRLEKVFTSHNVPLTYRRRNSREANYTQGISTSGYLPTYDYRGMNIILEPKPSQSETNGLLLVAKFTPPKLRAATAQTASDSDITLDASADPRNDYYNSAHIYISSGTGAGQIRVISDYDGSTKVATVSSDWDTNPDSTSVYCILIHEDFPEQFQALIPMYATKMGYLKERSRLGANSYDAEALKELELEFKQFVDERTEARKFVQPFHPELNNY